MKENNIRLSILAIPRPLKRLIVMILDVALSVFGVWLSYYLRTGYLVPIWDKVNEHYLLPACIIAIVIFLPVFMMFNLYRTIFRYSGSKAMLTVGKAVAVYAFIYSTIFTVIGIDGVPRTIGIIQPLIFLFLIGFSRFIALYWLGGMYIDQLQQSKKPRALIFGTGIEGRQLIIALANNPEINIVGYLDDDPKLHGNQINGLIVYNPVDIKTIVKKKRINEIILVLSHINRRRRSDIVQSLRGESIVIRTLPSYADVSQGRVALSDIRELSIEDILGRTPVVADPKLMQSDIKGKIVLVTGAGGSIGSELCRKIYRLKPKQLVLFDHSEFALYTILEELKALPNFNHKRFDIIPRLGSVTDEMSVQNLLKELKPETIFHSAAYKHVPLVENNKFAGIKNNVFGALILAQAGIAIGVKKIVLISSDKAVRPTNVMGASKRVAEMVLQALSATQNKTIFTIVRFGNVLDSSGSVVPLFKSQIKSGGPVTVTHVDVTRYFMTISEAAELVIQAASMTETEKKPGLFSPIYLLDMGKPIKIYDLAKLMIELSGLTVFDKVTGDGDIEIKFTGLRPGEKLFEELLIGDDQSDSIHTKIKYANEEFLPWPTLNKRLSQIIEAIKIGDQKSVVILLEKLVSGFNSSQR